MYIYIYMRYIIYVFSFKLYDFFIAVISIYFIRWKLQKICFNGDAWILWRCVLVQSNFCYSLNCLNIMIFYCQYWEWIVEDMREREVWEYFLQDLWTSTQPAYVSYWQQTAWLKNNCLCSEGIAQGCLWRINF